MKVSKCKLTKCPTCKQTDSVFKVSQMMKRKKERNAIVVDKNRPIGIISSIDIVYKVIAPGKSPKSVKAKAVMNKVHTVDGDEHVVRAYLAMAKKGFMSCPVVKNNRYLGTLYMHEAVRAISKKKK